MCLAIDSGILPKAYKSSWLVSGYCYRTEQATGTYALIWLRDHPMCSAIDSGILPRPNNGIEDQGS
ncbi:12410_t:CDS:1, partial [Dentiscutata erythropus]